MTKTAVWIALIICVAQIINSWVLKWYEIRNKEKKDDNKNKIKAAKAEETYKPFRYRFYHVLLSWIILSWSVFTLIWIPYFSTTSSNAYAVIISVSTLNIWISIKAIFIEPFIDKRFDRLSMIDTKTLELLKEQVMVNSHFNERIDALEKKLETRQEKK